MSSDHFLFALTIWPLLAVLVLWIGLSLFYGAAQLFFAGNPTNAVAGEILVGIFALFLTLPSLLSLVWICRMVVGHAKGVGSHRIATIITVWVMNAAVWGWLMLQLSKID